MSESYKTKSKMTAVIGVFIAITVVLQIISYFVKIGTFSLTLTLVPIILVSVMYGPKYSVFLGTAFGIVTIIGCITGTDAGGNILFNASPFFTVLLCMIKAILCSLVAGFVGTALKRKNLFLAVIITAIIAPIINTGSFIILMFLFFKGILYEWAGGTDIVTYLLIGLTGINFIIELGINVVLSPIILRILKAVKRYF